MPDLAISILRFTVILRHLQASFRDCCQVLPSIPEQNGCRLKGHNPRMLAGLLPSSVLLPREMQRACFKPELAMTKSTLCPTLSCQPQVLSCIIFAHCWS